MQCLDTFYKRLVIFTYFLPKFYILTDFNTHFIQILVNTFISIKTPIIQTKTVIFHIKLFYIINSYMTKIR